MPASIIAAVITNVVVTQIATTVMLSTFMTAALRLVIGFVVTSVVNSALGGKKAKADPAPSPFVDVQKRTVTFKQAVVPWQIIYGKTRVGGAITFAASTGNDLWMVITFAGHVCQEIESIYFNEELVSVDGSGNASGRYAGYAFVYKSLGEEAGQPFAALTAAGVGWTDAHRQTGRTKIAVRLVANRDLYPSGIPNITAVIKGRKVIDPRVSPTQETYSNNAALCSNDYLINTNFGFGADYATEVEEDELISSANDCDDAIALAGSPSATEARYTANGAVSVAEEPKQILGYLLAAMSGKAANIGGKWYILSGVYSVPTIDLDESDLIGAIRVQSMVSRRENCNGIKGTFTDPLALYQPSSFPPIPSDTYKNEDGGERVWRDIDLATFVTSGSQAQRIAKIDLLATRQGLSVVASFRISAWRSITGKTVSLTNAKFGWTAKPFEVAQTKLTVGDDGTLGVELTLRETAAAVYDWSTSEEQSVDIAPNSSLPSLFGDLDVSSLVATSGTADLLLQGDGTVVPRVRLRWTAPSNPFVEHYEIQFATNASPTEWRDAPQVIAPATDGFAFPVHDGDVVDLRIKAVTTFGNGGAWSYVLGHTVVGKTALPSDVTGATAVQTGGIVVMGCNEVTDADLDAIEVRLHDEGEEDWDDATPTANILRGQTVTSAALPPGNFNLLFKARDTSGNYSETAQVIAITVTADGYTTISSEAQGPDWLGLKTNMIRHWTGVLVPDSQSLASALTDAQLWEQFCYNPYADCYYEAQVIDKGIDATARIYGDIVSVLGVGESSGVAAPTLEVDTRLDAGSFDGFMTWTVGTDNFRHLKARLHVDTSIGKPVISQFTPTIDGVSREESGTLTIGGGGSGSATFTTPFHATPVLQVSPQGSGAVSASYDSLSTSGFTGYFKTGGVASAGTLSYTATGA